LSVITRGDIGRPTGGMTGRPSSALQPLQQRMSGGNAQPLGRKDPNRAGVGGMAAGQWYQQQGSQAGGAPNQQISFDSGMPAATATAAAPQARNPYEGMPVDTGSAAGAPPPGGGGIDLTGIGANAAPMQVAPSLAGLMGRGGGGGGGGEMDPPMVPTSGYSNIGRRVENPAMRVLRSRVY
jgi:hypothetical protein